MRHLILLVFCFALLAPAAVASPAADDVVVQQNKPEGYVLSAAYPNPFNPSTSFSLKVDEQQQVSVEVFNMLGQRVQTLFEGVMEDGETKTFQFDAGDLPSGIYLYRVTGQEFVATRHITLLK